MKSNSEHINDNFILQFTRNYKIYTLVYTLFDDGNEFELWVKVAGCGRMALTYGGYSKDLCKNGLNMDYCINDDLIEELTGEEVEE